MTESFPAASGVTVAETTTDSGDTSWSWSEQRGYLTVGVEVAWVPGRERWLRWFGPDRAARSVHELDWPVPADEAAARETVRERAGR